MSETPNPQQQKAAELRQLALDYKCVFGSPRGKIVLADMHRAFGFGRCPADSETLTDNQIARRVCMQKPLFHIQRMLEHDFRANARPQRARSAKEHHEPTETTGSAGNPQ